MDDWAMHHNPHALGAVDVLLELARELAVVHSAGVVHRDIMSVWQEAPILAGVQAQRVVLEAELPEAEAQGSFSVELWEEGRTRTVIFGGVSFP